MARRIPDAGRDDPVLILWMGIDLEARKEASPHPDRVGAERQRSGNGPAIGNAAGTRRLRLSAISAAATKKPSAFHHVKIALRSGPVGL